MLNDRLRFEKTKRALGPIPGLFFFFPAAPRLPVHVFDHSTTRLFTLPTFRGAGGHVLIVGDAAANLRTGGTRVGTRGTDLRRVRSAARRDLRRRRANGCTIVTRGQRGQMSRFAAMQLMRAVRGAHVTFPLAIRAGFGAFLHHFLVFGMDDLLFLRKHHGRRRKRQRECSSESC